MQKQTNLKATKNIYPQLTMQILSTVKMLKTEVKKLKFKTLKLRLVIRAVIPKGNVGIEQLIT